MRQMLQTNPPYLHNSAVSYPGGVLRCSIVASETSAAISGAALQMVVGGCCPGFSANAAS